MSYSKYRICLPNLSDQDASEQACRWAEGMGGSAVAVERHEHIPIAKSSR
jgi:hypothetical protein